MKVRTHIWIVVWYHAGAIIWFATAQIFFVSLVLKCLSIYESLIGALRCCAFGKENIKWSGQFVLVLGGYL